MTTFETMNRLYNDEWWSKLRGGVIAKSGKNAWNNFLIEWHKHCPDKKAKKEFIKKWRIT